MKDGKTIFRVGLKVLSLTLPMILALVNHAQMEDEVAKVVKEALTSKNGAEES